MYAISRCFHESWIIPQEHLAFKARWIDVIPCPLVGSLIKRAWLFPEYRKAARLNAQLSI